MSPSAVWWVWVVVAAVLSSACGDGDGFARDPDTEVDGSGQAGSQGTGSGAGASSGGASSGGSAGSQSSGGDGGNGASGSGGDGGTSVSKECSDGEELCGGECVNISVSDQHCGGCNEPCADSEMCSNGACSDTCPSPLTECNGNCTDLDRDSANCGMCGRSCPSGTPCVGGSCGCPDYTLFCAGGCTDPDNDPDHCGACNEACPEGAGCFEGACGCPEGAELCDDACVPLNTPEHCGDCGVECASDQLCAPEGCIAETQPCPTGTERCGAACVNTDAAANHCGGCDQACPAATYCDGGSCHCVSGDTLCADACVDLQTNSLNCGSCGHVCGAGQICQNGACACSDQGFLLCDDACVDPTSDVQNCGSCRTTCTGGYPCTDGECRCPTGEILCGGECVNPESDANHCGGCGYECPAGQSCVVGACSGAVGDDCTNELALDITLTDIAVYQAGKVDVMIDGAQVAAQERNADVVAGKDALIRAFVELEPGFESRVLSARLVLVDDQQVEQRFHKRTVSQDSTDSSLATTFNFEIEGELITPTTRYSVELVECDAAMGSEFRPRYPTGGSEELEARDTGILTVAYVPILVNGRTPNTDSDRLDAYSEYVASMYPVTAVEHTLATPLSANAAITASGSGWDEVLQQLSDRHTSDGAPNDAYYYGLLEPAATESEYCSSGCVAGIGYITGPQISWQHMRVSMGISYGNLSSAETMAHEVGHNHGREHSPCGGASDADPNYPYPGGRIGWWGFIYPDTLRNPNGSTDVMGYCGGVWISDYTYQGIADRVAALSASLSIVGGAPVGLWRVMITGPSGPRWGVAPEGRVAAGGEPEAATVLDRNGNAIAIVTVYRARMDHLGSSSIMVPEPSSSWHAIVVDGEPALAFGATDASVP